MIKAENRRILITVDPETESYIAFVKDYMKSFHRNPSNSDVLSFLCYWFYQEKGKNR